MGTDPAVLFLHAGVADRRSWVEVQRAIAGEFSSTAYDRRGFGDTEYQAESHSHVEDLLAVHEMLGREPIVLVAPANSGMQAPIETPPATAALLARIDAADEAEDLQLVNELEAEFWLDGPESEAGRVDGETRELFLQMNGRALAADPTGEEREPPSVTEFLNQLLMPVHLMLGGLDLVHITDRGKWIADQVPQGDSKVFEDAAHLPQLENQPAFTQDLLAFLRSLEG